jgi:hypothetical protein
MRNFTVGERETGPYLTPGLGGWPSALRINATRVLGSVIARVAAKLHGLVRRCR